VSHPSKRKGYRGEIRARDELRRVGLHELKLTGSVNYKDSAPDLVQLGTPEAQVDPLLIVATQADRRPFLYSLTAHDLYTLLRAARMELLDEVPVAVQVKKHKAFAIDTLYRRLEAATRWR
jgi:hypothetical protein